MTMNIIADVMAELGTSKAQYVRYSHKATDSRGKYIIKYHYPVDIHINVQPISIDIRKELGLDTTVNSFFAWLNIKNYECMSTKVKGTPDRIIYMCTEYEIHSITDWSQFGWIKVVMTEQRDNHEQL